MTKTDHLDLETILKNIREYSGVTCLNLFGLDEKTHYDALVVAPGWKPDTCIADDSFFVIPLKQRWYTSGHLVTREGINIAWIQCAAGSSNLIDHLLPCLGLDVGCIIFAGAVGGLKPEIEIGDICTPSECIDPDIGASAYLRKKLFTGNDYPIVKQDKRYIDRICSFVSEIKTEKVYCTDSIALEYSHLDEITETGAALIEMETAAFLKITELTDIPRYILLAVSDNSSSGKGMMTEEMAKERKRYKNCVGYTIPHLIYKLALFHSRVKTTIS